MIGNLLLKIKQFIKEQTCLHNYVSKVWLNEYEVCLKCGKVK
jgi:hypothetical protein